MASKISSSCDSAELAHNDLVHAILTCGGGFESQIVRDEVISVDKSLLHSHRVVRELSSRFLLLFEKCSEPVARAKFRKLKIRSPRRLRRRFKVSKRQRHSLEFGLVSRYPTDGILLYVFAVLGARDKMVIEMDGASGSGIFRGSACFTLLHGWNAVLLYQKWSGFNTAHQYYEDSSPGGAFLWRKLNFPDSVVIVAEENELRGAANETIARNGVGGSVDLLYLLLDGYDLHTWKNVTIISPRVVVLFYQDFWGHKIKASRICNFSEHVNSCGETDMVDTGRKRLYNGGSIAAIASTAKKLGYRLIWCLRSAPIALFLKTIEDPHNLLFKTVRTKDCVSQRESPEWRLDMEAQWDYAQRFSWDEGPE